MGECDRLHSLRVIAGVTGATAMKALVIVIVALVVLLVVGAAMAARIVKQYEDGVKDGVLFRFGRVTGERSRGFRLIIPFAVAPGQLAIAAFSPRLDPTGSSVRAQLAVAQVARELHLNLYLPNQPCSLPRSQS